MFECSGLGCCADRGTRSDWVVVVMAIAIHPVHRRMAELQLAAKKRGGYHMLTTMEQIEFQHCMHVNAQLVLQIDQLKELAYFTHCLGDMEWQMEVCEQLDAMEARMA